MSTVLVTGGSRGIGRGICVAFARAGYDVAFCYSKDEDGARETARLIEKQERKFFGAMFPTKNRFGRCLQTYSDFRCS